MDYITLALCRKKGGGSMPGQNGATFIPIVDEQGNLSWTNDKGLPNPPVVNIRGKDGITPQKGVDYWTSADEEKLNQALEAKQIADNGFALAQTNEEDIRLNEVDITLLKASNTELTNELETVKNNIPVKLPNPYPLTFTGAIRTSYDGSEPLSVEIPQPGGLVLDLQSHPEAYMVQSITKPWTITLDTIEYTVLDNWIHHGYKENLSIMDKDELCFTCIAEVLQLSGLMEFQVIGFQPGQNALMLGIMSYNLKTHTLTCQGYAFMLTPAG